MLDVCFSCPHIDAYMRAFVLGDYSTCISSLIIASSLCAMLPSTALLLSFFASLSSFSFPSAPFSTWYSRGVSHLHTVNKKCVHGNNCVYIVKYLLSVYTKLLPFHYVYQGKFGLYISINHWFSTQVYTSSDITKSLKILMN